MTFLTPNFYVILSIIVYSDPLTSQEEDTQPPPSRSLELRTMSKKRISLLSLLIHSEEDNNYSGISDNGSSEKRTASPERTVRNVPKSVEPPIKDPPRRGQPL